MEEEASSIGHLLENVLGKSHPYPPTPMQGIVDYPFFPAQEHPTTIVCRKWQGGPFELVGMSTQLLL